MPNVSPRPFLKSLALLLLAILLPFNTITLAQSRPQKGEPPKSGGKKNQRPTPKTEAEIKAEEERRKQEEEDRNAEVDEEVLKIKTNIVNVDAVVYNKKTGQIITGLKRENFAVFENGVKQEITNFARPKRRLTVTMVIEFSKWTEMFGLYGRADRNKELWKWFARSLILLQIYQTAERLRFGYRFRHSSDADYRFYERPGSPAANRQHSFAKQSGVS
jgi:hypothetical protein